MTTFFVGQKVRVVASEYLGEGPHPAGLEARIIGHGSFVGTSGLFYEYRLETLTGRIVVCDSFEIEPILPSGHRASEFSFTELMDRCREGIAA